MPGKTDDLNLNERLEKAVTSLATSEASLQKRLYYAAETIFPLQEKEFPGLLRAIYKNIREKLTNNHTSEMPKVTAVMSDEEAKKLIEQIVELATDYWQWQDGSEFIEAKYS